MTTYRTTPIKNNKTYLKDRIRQVSHKDRKDKIAHPKVITTFKMIIKNQ